MRFGGKHIYLFIQYFCSSSHSNLSFSNEEASVVRVKGCYHRDSVKFEYDGKVLRFDKELSELDEFVIKFVELIRKSNIRYVIISGYVAIVMGRSRTTEDIDIFIEKTDFETFRKFFELAGNKGYWSIDSDSLEDAFDRLQDSLSIRMAKKDTVIPNFEIKFPKKEIDLISLNRPLSVIINKNELLMSPLEVQIPFKIWLSSEKDIEDAMHIYELFGAKLDKKLMKNISKRLKIDREMIKYGIN